MKATDINAPGLYWHRYNENSQWAFALVVQHGEGKERRLNMVRLTPDPENYKDSFQALGEDTVGEFAGPIPESPAANIAGTVHGVRPETLAAIMLPLPCDDAFQRLCKVWPKAKIRGAGNVMFIDGPPGK